MGNFPFLFFLCIYNATYVPKVTISHKSIPKDHLMKEEQHIKTYSRLTLALSTVSRQFSPFCFLVLPLICFQT